MVGEGLRCVILAREKPSQSWEFVTLTTTEAVALKSAAYIEKQERVVLNHPTFETKVMYEEDYYDGKTRGRQVGPRRRTVRGRGEVSDSVGVGGNLDGNVPVPNNGEAPAV